MRLVRITGRLLGRALFLLAMAAFGLLAVGPLTGRYRVVTVMSGSMRPSLPAGSVAVATPVPLDALRVGDVITYRAPVGQRQLVTHRIVEVVRAGSSPIIETKGDANRRRDPWTARLVGGEAWRTRAAVPVVGSVLVWLRTPAARVATVIVAPALLALIWLREIWARRDETPLPGRVASGAA